MADRVGNRGRQLGIREFRACYQRGLLVELADHSVWRISPGHEIFTRRWAKPTRITVVPGADSGYPYELINNDSGDKVPAREANLQLWTEPSNRDDA